MSQWKSMVDHRRSLVETLKLPFNFLIQNWLLFFKKIKRRLFSRLLPLSTFEDRLATMLKGDDGLSCLLPLVTRQSPFTPVELKI